MARRKDICIINPKAPALENDLAVSFVPMPKVGEDGTPDPYDCKTVRDVKKGFTYFQEGDVLFAKITPYIVQFHCLSHFFQQTLQCLGRGCILKTPA